MCLKLLIVYIFEVKFLKQSCDQICVFNNTVLGVMWSLGQRQKNKNKQKTKKLQNNTLKQKTQQNKTPAGKLVQ